MSLMHTKYRADIDGLRAVAILVVILFHAFPEVLPGGFIGVDIFFVISGFLISTIIFSSLEKDCFSFGEFYLRRIRRLFPALIVVLIACLIFGWVVLFPDEYGQLGKHTAAAVAFLQNIVLLRESGYFDSTALTKPLLHFWSLAVEEQFYICWPLLLVLVYQRNWRFSRLTVVIAALSFAVNIYLLSSGRPLSAFYFPFSRFWELMAGGLLASVLLHRPQLIEKYPNVQSLLGFTLLGSGLFFLNKEKNFPGFWALLPATGTFFILSAGSAAWLNHKLLANKCMVGIGLISYPLYLWHWPLLSFLFILEGKTSVGLRLAAISSAAVLAWLTFAWVEKPLRTVKKFKNNAIPLTTSMLVIFVAAVLSYKTDIFQKHNEQTAYIAWFDNSLPKWNYHTREKLLKKYRADCDFYNLDEYRSGHATMIPRTGISKHCSTRNPAFSRAVLLWGDSHVQQLYYGLRKNLPDNWQILLGVSSGCPADPDIAAPSTTNYCDQSNWNTLETIKKTRPDVVVVGQAFNHSTAKMREIAAKLQQLGVKKILFTGPVPQWDPPLHKIIARKLWKNTPKHTFIGLNQDIIHLNTKLARHFKATNSVQFLNLIDFFCNQKGCLTYLGKDKQQGITTFDYGHLTPIASNQLAQQLLVGKIVS